MATNFDLSKLLITNPNPTRRQKLGFVWSLSLPGMLAQISSILMQYIDAAMVGGLGANASAAIGLVASSTWVIGSLSSALSIGYTVQVANAVGAGNQKRAKGILVKATVSCLIFSLLLTAAALALSGLLPTLLGAEEVIKKDASIYFFVYALSTPFFQMIYLMGGMLQCSGNMKVPSILNSLLCILDAAFNVIFIKLMGLGVLGAALGTTASAVFVSVFMVYFTVHKSEYLGITRGRRPGEGERLFSHNVNREAFRLAAPIAVEKVAFTGALVAITRIIAPLGAVALSANSFAVTAEALCYMPGYGLSEAATTLVGQSYGARRQDLASSFSWITVFAGSLIMLLTGLVMYFLCPLVFKLLTPVPEIQALAVKVLRIELFAEPLYGASIVASGALRGQKDTLIPSILNLISLWIVRLGLSLLLVGHFALEGIWMAMAIELCFRGLVLAGRLFYKTRHKS
ncbi:MAG: MATE family efflux transporter [Treponemataceae bacterium]|nr:MATE family efflux transporter [Treponemataceae bacterium]